MYIHVIFISMDLQEDAVSFWLKLCVNIVNDSKTPILLQISVSTKSANISKVN